MPVRMQTGPIKVLIVDDSPFMRSLLTKALSSEPGIQVVGAGKDPYEARDLIIQHRPEVILLDIEMPRMDGLTFLGKLMEHYPVPVIMVSGVAPTHGRVALEAIELGAIDVVAKPNSGGSAAMRQVGEELAEKIRAATVARRPPPVIPVVSSAQASFVAAGLDPDRHLVAIGASTGGTDAVKQLLAHAPADFPPTVIVQHMPEGFTKSFAERLNECGPLTVREAEDGDVLGRGQALLGRGGVQMRVYEAGRTWRVSYGETTLTNRHCPSVNVLFDSVAEAAGASAIGILLTGMGDDGATGLLNMRRAGAITATQSERSCVVYGMPKVAVQLGASQHTGLPSDMPRIVRRALLDRATEPAAGKP